MKASMLAALLLFSLHAHADTDHTSRVELTPLSPEEIGATPSATIEAEASSNTDTYYAGVSSEIPAASALEQIDNLLRIQGLNPADFKAFTPIPSTDKAYLVSASLICEYENRFKVGGENTIFKTDHMECESKRPAQGSKTISTFDAQGSYDADASDVFDNLSRAGVTQQKENGTLTVEVSSVICSKTQTFGQHDLASHCSLIDAASKKSIHFAPDMKDRSGGDLTLEFSLQMSILLKIPQKFANTSSIYSSFVGVDSIKCTQAIDNAIWKHTTCTITWSPESTSAERQSLL